MSTNQNQHKGKQEKETIETLFAASPDLADLDKNQDLATQHTMVDRSSHNSKPRTIVNEGLQVPESRTEHTIVENETAQTQQTIAYNSQQKIDCEEQTQQTGVQENSLQTKLPTIFAEKYHVLGILGAGAMGKVFKALDKTSNQEVAIKVIHKSQEDSQDIVKRFYRESKLLEKLNHPHIIKIYEQGEYKGQPYFVMDLVQGTTLTAVLKQKNYPLRRKLSLLVQVLEAVDCAHREGVIHRDLKPDNIMVTPKAKALVMDFGIARDQDDKNATKLTKTGMLVGTPLYMSPEQINGEKVTNTSDIYTLGVIMYEIITGKVPFRGNLSKIMWQVAHSDPPHPREVSSSVAKDLSKICLKAMSKVRDKRYITAKAMADDVRRYLKGQKILAKSSFSVKKWFSKNRSSLLLPCVVLIVGLIFLNQKASQNKNEIVGQNDVAENEIQNSENTTTKPNNIKLAGDKRLEENASHNKEPHLEDGAPQNKESHLEDQPQNKEPHLKDQPQNKELHPQDKLDRRHDKEQQNKHLSDGRPHDEELHDKEPHDKNKRFRDKRPFDKKPHDGDKRRRNEIDEDEEFFDEESDNEFVRNKPHRHRRFEDIEERVDKRFERGNRNVDKRFENGEEIERPNRRDKFGLKNKKKLSRSEILKLNRHFRFCKECHRLLRKNRIKLARPPRLTKLPKEILLKIKAHAEND